MEMTSRKDLFREARDAPWGAEKMMVRDPVCGMEIDEKETPCQYEYKGEAYHSCATYSWPCRP
jgi:hypothetical protein